MKAVAVGLVLAIISMVALPVMAAPLIISQVSRQFAFRSGSTPPPSVTVPPPSQSPGAGPGPEPTLSPAPNPPPATQLPSGVKFDIRITNVSGSGLSQTVTARISNTGTADAHNAWIKVELFTQGERVKLDGQDYMRVDIGTLSAGTSVTREATITVSPLDGLKIASNGSRFILTLNCDEGSQTLAYDYKP